jgi:hypothetical protein
MIFAIHVSGWFDMISESEGWTMMLYDSAQKFGDAFRLMPFVLVL